MAKKCFTCAHWNREGSKFCEYCGAKLPAKEIQLEPQTYVSIKKWKAISAISIAIIVILASGLFYYFSNFNQFRDSYVALSGQYNSLQSSYGQLSIKYSTLQNQYNQLGTNYDNLNIEHMALMQHYNDLNDKYIVLNDSFLKLLDANNRIRNEINDLQGKIVNYAPYDDTQQIIYSYTDDMKNFVLNSIRRSRLTRLLSPEEYFQQDLYFIHQDWSNVFTVDSEANPMITISGIATDTMDSTLPTGQTYLWVASLDILNSSFATAPLIFKEKRGVCHHFSLTLTELYRCYLDIQGTPYSSYSVFQLMLENPLKDFRHACVLIKSPYGQVAIIDWSVLSPNPWYVTYSSVTFRSIYEETKLHQEYWGFPLNYTTVFSSNYWKAFKNNDEFFEWTQGSG